ncbi:hypothetical protein [Pseudalkalibacillus sp. R45]|uniref:hypothetical protein n=1 Tax=Pseudalkalibacillus sp. R45 TaxID=3457433 RepID=UPI003FCCD675
MVNVEASPSCASERGGLRIARGKGVNFAKINKYNKAQAKEKEDTASQTLSFKRIIKAGVFSTSLPRIIKFILNYTK